MSESSSILSDNSLDEREVMINGLRDIIKKKEETIDALTTYKEQFNDAKVRIKEFASKIMQQKSIISEKNKLIATILREIGISGEENSEKTVEKVIELSNYYQKYSTVIKTVMKILKITNFDENILIQKISNLNDENSKLNEKISSLSQICDATEDNMFENIKELVEYKEINEEFQNEAKNILNIDKFNEEVAIDKIKSLIEQVNELSHYKEEVSGALSNESSSENIREVIEDIISEKDEISEKLNKLTTERMEVCNIVGSESDNCEKEDLINKIKEIKEKQLKDFNDEFQAVKSELSKAKQEESELSNLLGTQSYEGSYEEIKEMKENEEKIKKELNGETIKKAISSLQNSTNEEEEEEEDLNEREDIVKKIQKLKEICEINEEILKASEKSNIKEVADEIRNAKKENREIKEELDKEKNRNEELCTNNESRINEINSALSLDDEESVVSKINQLRDELDDEKEKTKAQEENIQSFIEATGAQNANEAIEKAKKLVDGFSKICNIINKDATNIEDVQEEIQKQKSEIEKVTSIFGDNEEEEENIEEILEKAEKTQKAMKEICQTLDAEEDEAPNCVKEIKSSVDEISTIIGCDKVQELPRNVQFYKQNYEMFTEASESNGIKPEEFVSNASNAIEANKKLQNLFEDCDVEELPTKVEELQNNYEEISQLSGLEEHSDVVEFVAKAISAYNSFNDEFNGKEASQVSSEISDLEKELNEIKKEADNLCNIMESDTLKESVAAVETIKAEKEELAKQKSDIAATFNIEENEERLEEIISEKFADLKKALELSEEANAEEFETELRKVKEDCDELSERQEKVLEILNEENPENVEQTIKEMKETEDKMKEMGFNNIVNDALEMKKENEEAQNSKNQIFSDLGIDPSKGNFEILESVFKELREENNALKEKEESLKSIMNKVADENATALALLSDDNQGNLVESIQELINENEDLQTDKKQLTKQIKSISLSLNTPASLEEILNAISEIKTENCKVKLENDSTTEKYGDCIKTCCTALELDSNNKSVDEIEENILNLKRKYSSMKTRLGKIFDLPKENQTPSEIFIAAKQLKRALDEQNSVREEPPSDSVLELQQAAIQNKDLKEECDQLRESANKMEDRIQILKDSIRDKQEEIKKQEENISLIYQTLGPGVLNIKAAVRIISKLQEENENLQKQLSRSRKVESLVTNLKSFKNEQTERIRVVSERLSDQADTMKRTLHKTLDRADEAAEKEIHLTKILKTVENDNKKLLTMLDNSESTDDDLTAPSDNGVPLIQKRFTKLPDDDKPFTVKRSPKGKSSPVSNKNHSSYKQKMAALDIQYVRKKRESEKMKSDIKNSSKCRHCSNNSDIQTIL